MPPRKKGKNLIPPPDISLVEKHGHDITNPCTSVQRHSRISVPDPIDSGYPFSHPTTSTAPDDEESDSEEAQLSIMETDAEEEHESDIAEEDADTGMDTSENGASENGVAVENQASKRGKSFSPSAIRNRKLKRDLLLRQKKKGSIAFLSSWTEQEKQILAAALKKHGKDADYAVLKQDLAGIKRTKPKVVAFINHLKRRAHELSAINPRGLTHKDVSACKEPFARAVGTKIDESAVSKYNDILKNEFVRVLEACSVHRENSVVNRLCRVIVSALDASSSPESLRQMCYERDLHVLKHILDRLESTASSIAPSTNLFATAEKRLSRAELKQIAEFPVEVPNGECGMSAWSLSLISELNPLRIPAVDLILDGLVTTPRAENGLPASESEEDIP